MQKMQKTRFFLIILHHPVRHLRPPLRGTSCPEPFRESYLYKCKSTNLFVCGNQEVDGRA